MSLIGMLPKILAEAKRRYKSALKNPAENFEAVDVMNAGEVSNIQGTVTQCDNAIFLASHIADGSLAGRLNLIYCDPPFLMPL